MKPFTASQSFNRAGQVEDRIFLRQTDAVLPLLVDVHLGLNAGAAQRQIVEHAVFHRHRRARRSC